MIVVERTFDLELIKSIATHPKVYPHINDDNAPSAEQYQPPDPWAVWYITVKDEGELLGMFALIPQSSVCFEVHTCLLPVAWGERATLAARAGRAWMWVHSPCRRIITNIPDDNRLALRFAKRAGMTEFGINEKSRLRGGKLIDQHLLGVSAWD